MTIAPLMFADRSGMRAVERFMKRYYLAALDVGNLTRIMCAAMEMDFRQRRTRWREDFRSGQSFTPSPFGPAGSILTGTMAWR